MTDTSITPVLVRKHELFELTCDGLWHVNGEMRFFTSAKEILAKPKHYLRAALKAVMSKIETGEIAGVVEAQIAGKMLYITVSREQYAMASAPIAQFAAQHTQARHERLDLRSKERAYDDLHNEGACGYNPYRQGDEPTYRRGAWRDAAVEAAGA